MCYTLYIFDEEATTVNEFNEQEITTELYPNPATDDVTIKTNFDQSGTYKIIMSAISGQIVFNQDNVFINNGPYQLNLNIESLASGLYTISIIGNDLKISYKIIKQ